MFGLYVACPVCMARLHLPGHLGGTSKRNRIEQLSLVSYRGSLFVQSGFSCSVLGVYLVDYLCPINLCFVPNNLTQ